MEERFTAPPPARENPRAAPTSGLILDRFRALARESDDVVQVYEELLQELTFNSKPIITELTIIAGEQRENGEGIADAICTRILEVPVDQKLPSLYLLDSIVKNIGREYLRYFAARLPKVFCGTYNQVHPNMHRSMRHLFGTWSQVFPSLVLRKIEEELQFSATENQRSAGLANVTNSGSPSPRPSHGIHVNPKFFDLKHSTAVAPVDTQKNANTAEFEEDVMERVASESPRGWSGASPKFHDKEHASGNSSRLHVYGHNSSAKFGDHDLVNSDVLPSLLRKSKANVPQFAAIHTSVSGAEGPTHHSNIKVSRSLSPSRPRPRRSASPIDDSLQKDGSPWRTAGRTSQSHHHRGFMPGGTVSQNGLVERSWPPSVARPQIESSNIYEPDVRYTKKHPRELIDAYGNHRGNSTSLEKLPKIQRVDANGTHREATTRHWRSFEEEEYVWEDMSPTLSDRNRRNNLPPLGPSSGNLNRGVGLSRPDVNILEPDYRGNNWLAQAKHYPVDDAAMITDDRVSSIGPGHASMQMEPLDRKPSPSKLFHQYRISPHIQEAEKFPHSGFQHASEAANSIPRSWESNKAIPVNGMSMTIANGQKLPSAYDNSSDVKVSYQKLPGIHTSALSEDSCLLERQLELRPFSPPAAPVQLASVHRSQPLPSLPIPSNQQQLKNPYNPLDSTKPIIQGANQSMFLAHQQFELADRQTSISSIASSAPLQQAQTGIMHTNQQSQEQGGIIRIRSQQVCGGYAPTLPAHLSSQLLAQPPNQMQVHTQGVPMGSFPDNHSALASSGAMHSMPDNFSFVRSGIKPPLPPGPPPESSQLGSAPQNSASVVSGSPVSAFSGLISTLMAQGLISLGAPTQSEATVGLEFNAERLKVRHEAAINALYSNLPRQCTTCGLRFKCQEEHRNHMDWHVTKNRVSRNRKQKPSRKWFVNTKEWLSGAETVGTDVVPFLPMEVVLEKNEDKEMAVPADENQTVCALCGEPFDDFYSDEAEEWMYKGAVYLNAPDGNVAGLDRSQLGPIVHAKCRPESTEGS